MIDPVLPRLDKAAFVGQCRALLGTASSCFNGDKKVERARDGEEEDAGRSGRGEGLLSRLVAVGP